MSIKKNILSKIITTVPVEESFFFRTELPRKAKLSKELILLNYQHHSPFKGADTLFTFEDTQLYIWYSKQIETAPIVIPEGYLLYTFFKKKYDDAIIIIENISLIYIFVIRKGVLLSNFSVSSIDEKMIETLSQQYFLACIIKLNHKEYQAIYSKLFQSISYQDIWRWKQWDIDRERIGKQALDGLAYPVSFLLLLIMGLNIFHTNSLNKDLESVQEQYIEARNMNNSAKAVIKDNSKRTEVWKKFIQEEHPYTNSLTVLNELNKEFVDKNTNLLSLSVIGSKFKLSLQTDKSAVHYLNTLNKISVLSNITIKHVDRKKKTVQFEADILPEKVTQ